MSVEVLQLVEKRKEAKDKGEKERYTHLKAESQRIARRDKKAFFSDQCKEIVENNRMGKQSPKENTIEIVQAALLVGTWTDLTPLCPPESPLSFIAMAHSWEAFSGYLRPCLPPWHSSRV